MNLYYEALLCTRQISDVHNHLTSDITSILIQYTLKQVSSPPSRPSERGKLMNV